MATLLDIVKKGSTDRSVCIRIIDSGDGTPETGVVFNTSGIDLWYRREGAALTSITEATLAALTTAHSDGGFLHVGNGEYRLDLPDAAFATGANYVDIGGTVTGMIVIGGRVRLVNYDPEDTVRLGLTALPNAAAEAAGGLFTRGTGAGQINQAANGMIDTNPVRLNNVSQSLLDLKDFADDGYDPSTNKIAGLVLADTVTTLTNLPAITANWLTAAGMAADVSTELRTAINGGDYALSTDANGRVRIVDGTGTGEINTASGVVQAALADGVTHGGSTADLLLRDLSFGGDWNVVGSVVFDNAGNDIRGVRLSTTGINAVADQVWLETLADHSGSAGSTAEALNAAGAAGDPWTTALPGAYGAGSAGFIIGTNLNATISSRATQTSVDDIPTNAELATALGTADDAVLAAIAALNDVSQADITGGAYALSTDANGRVRIVDGTGTGEIDTASGRVMLVDGSLTEDTPDATFAAGIVANVQLALENNNLDHLMKVAAVTGDVTNNSIIARLTSKAATATFGDFNNTTDSLEALRDRGDAAWLTAAGFSTLSASDVTAAVWHADVAANDNTVGSFGDYFGQVYQGVTVDIPTSITALNDLDAAGIRAAVGLASANLDTQLDALPTANEVRNAVTGGAYPLDTDANGRVRIVDGTGAGEIDTNGGAIASVLALGATALAAINLEVVDGLNGDTYAEPSQGAPPATASLATKIGWLYTTWRNKKEQAAGGVLSLFADDGITVLAKSTKSDDGSTFQAAEYITGA